MPVSLGVFVTLDDTLKTVGLADWLTVVESLWLILCVPGALIVGVPCEEGDAETAEEGDADAAEEEVADTKGVPDELFNTDSVRTGLLDGDILSLGDTVIAVWLTDNVGLVV